MSYVFVDVCFLFLLGMQKLRSLKVRIHCYFLLACINRSNNTSALKFQQLRALCHFKEKGGTVL